MKVAACEYTIKHGQYSQPDSDHVTLEAIKIVDGKRLGHIYLELMPAHESAVKLGKITSYYPIRTVGGGAIDYGGNGVGTMLLLQGMAWAREKDTKYVVGQFAPETELYAVKSWYEKRGIIVSEDMQSISGIVIAVISACQNIIARY